MVVIATTMEITQREVRAMKPFSQHAVEVSETCTETYAVKQQNQSKKFEPCRRCGRRHNEQHCPAVDWQCFTCSKRGHTSRLCNKNENKDSANHSGNSMGRHNNNNNKGNKVNAVYHVDDHEVETYVIKSISTTALTKSMSINGQTVNMEVDTGAVLAIMSYREFKEKFSHLKLEICTYRLITVTGELIGVAGKISVDVRGAICLEKLDLVITNDKHDYIPLLGRTWLDILYPGWRTNIFAKDMKIHAICELAENGIVSIIKKDFPLVLSNANDQAIVNCEAELILIDDARPIFHAPYTVPYKLRDKVKSEIDKLVNRGILIQVTHSKWATPIVHVPKPGDEIRICMDCKVTLNRVIQTEYYPLPKIEDIFASLSLARVFCVLDLKGAYQQIVV